MFRFAVVLVFCVAVAIAPGSAQIVARDPRVRGGAAGAGGAALSNIQVNLFSDLLLHRMGPQLADGIVQGQAQADGFRTVPLWGLGQRIFFLPDGRTKNLINPILYHARGDDSLFQGDRRYPDSEASAVINRYKKLPEQDKQDLLTFWCSL
jgi:CxxC motif-containing protein (DUF1111 family)